MKLLIFCLLLNPDTSVIEVDKDTSFLKRIQLNTELIVKFNFHVLALGKQKMDEIIATSEYSKYKQYQAIGVYPENYSKPEELGYAHVGTFRFMAGFDFATTLRFGKYEPELIYGVNLSYEKRDYITSAEVRKEIIDLYSADLISQGNSHPNFYVNDDTTLQRKRVDGLSCVIPVALRFPINKKIGIEAGAFIRVLGFAKYISTGNTIAIHGPTYSLGAKPNPYFAICCNVRNRFLVQIGADFSKTVFLSFQI